MRSVFRIACKTRWLRFPASAGRARLRRCPLPEAVFRFQGSITAPGAPGNTGDAERDKLIIDLIGVRSGYIEAMGIRLLAGRTFPVTPGWRYRSYD